MAARMLGVRPEDCVAIEDSNTGTISAVAAGCAVLVVPHHVPVEEGEGRAWRPRWSRSTSLALSRVLPSRCP